MHPGIRAAIKEPPKPPFLIFVKLLAKPEDRWNLTLAVQESREARGYGFCVRHDSLNLIRVSTFPIGRKNIDSLCDTRHKEQCSHHTEAEIKDNA